MKYSELIETEINLIDFDTVQELSDSSCGAGYDGDGSTLFEFVEAGFNLALKAAGRPVFHGTFDTEDGVGVVFFFIGEERDIIEQLKKPK